MTLRAGKKRQKGNKKKQEKNATIYRTDDRPVSFRCASEPITTRRATTPDDDHRHPKFHRSVRSSRCSSFVYVRLRLYATDNGYVDAGFPLILWFPPFPFVFQWKKKTNTTDQNWMIFFLQYRDWNVLLFFSFLIPIKAYWVSLIPFWFQGIQHFISFPVHRFGNGTFFFIFERKWEYSKMIEILWFSFWFHLGIKTAIWFFISFRFFFDSEVFLNLFDWNALIFYSFFKKKSPSTFELTKPLGFIDSLLIPLHQNGDWVPTGTPYFSILLFTIQCAFNKSVLFDCLFPNPVDQNGRLEHPTVPFLLPLSIHNQMIKTLARRVHSFSKPSAISGLSFLYNEAPKFPPPKSRVPKVDDDDDDVDDDWIACTWAMTTSYSVAFSFLFFNVSSFSVRDRPWKEKGPEVDDFFF